MKNTKADLPPSSLLGTDELGSPVFKVGKSNKRTPNYTAFGHVLTGLPQDTGFTGQLREPPSNIYALGNGYRSYSATLMRFLSADVLSPFAEGGLNAYAYCACNPIMARDPSGGSPAFLALGLIGLAGLGLTGAGAALKFGKNDDTGIPLMIGGGLLMVIGFAPLLIASKGPSRQTLHQQRKAAFRNMFENSRNNPTYRSNGVGEHSRRFDDFTNYSTYSSSSSSRYTGSSSSSARSSNHGGSTHSARSRPIPTPTPTESIEVPPAPSWMNSAKMVEKPNIRDYALEQWRRKFQGGGTSDLDRNLNALRKKFG